MAEKNTYIYNTNLAKSTGFINETLILLEFFEIGDTKESFLNRCIQYNPLDKSTERRSKDLITLVFFDRYWTDDSTILNLKALRENGSSLSVMRKLFLVYTARANRILLDFIKQIVLHNKTGTVRTNDAILFINDAITTGKAPEWSETMKKRVASYLISSLNNFEVIEKNGRINNFLPENLVVNYFLHELHFKGLSDNEIIVDDTWKILLMDEYELLKEIEKISFTGAFIFQNSGEIIKISWKYTSMNEFIENEYR